MEHIARRTLSFLLWVGLGSALATPIAGHAQDRPAPSQQLSSDPAPPVPDLTIGVDPIGMAFGEWGGRVELALSPSHAFFFAPGYRTGVLSPGISLEVGYHLFPLGNGLDGPFVGPSVGAAISLGDARFSLRGAMMAGWQVILGPIALALSGGIEAHLSPSSEAFQESGVIVLPRISLHIGYAIR